MRITETSCLEIDKNIIEKDELTNVGAGANFSTRQFAKIICQEAGVNLSFTQHNEAAKSRKATQNLKL